MVAGGNTEKDAMPNVITEERNTIYLLEQQLEDMIEKIDGVGRAEVILSLKYSEQNIYAKEEVKENDAAQTIKPTNTKGTTFLRKPLLIIRIKTPANAARIEVLEAAPIRQKTLDTNANN